MSESDIRHLRAALSLADRGEGGTRPNPPVGAVVVRRGRVVGQGYHARAGSAHAEVKALKMAGARARGATLYVTLEPCSTWGRTGPCTDAILKAGIRRVVAGTVDPNPAHAGRGFARLRRAGVAVTVGVQAVEAERLLAPFARWITGKLPLVTVKMGMTLDGRIADARGRSRWITSPAARRSVQELRRRADAILIGAGTARADDPTLRRHLPRKPPLLRVIVDARGGLSPDLKLFTDADAAHTILAATARCPAAKRRAFARHGARVWTLPERQGRVSLVALLRRLAREGVMHVLCEGGGVLAEALVRQELVERFVFFVAPKLLGAGAMPVLGGAGWPLSSAPSLRFVDCVRVGPDIMVTAEWQGPRRSRREH